MAYDIYLHRTFDTQLCTDPSSIIDWSPTTRMLRPVLQALNPQSAPPIFRSRRTEPWLVSLQALQEGVAMAEGTAASNSNSEASTPLTPTNALNGFDGSSDAMSNRWVQLHNSNEGNGADASGSRTSNAMMNGNHHPQAAATTSRVPHKQAVNTTGGERAAQPRGTNANGNHQTPSRTQPTTSSSSSRAWATLRDYFSMSQLQRPQNSAKATTGVCSSYGCMPIYSKDSFSVLAGLYAAVGVSLLDERYLGEGKGAGGGATTEGAAGGLLRSALARYADDVSHGAALKSKSGALQMVEVGVVERVLSLRAMNVLQLAWYWGARKWQGVFNVRVLPMAQYTRVPVCEYVLRTPWTETSCQFDELVISWSGFLTLYQQCVQGPEPPPQVAALKGTVQDAVKELVEAKNKARELKKQREQQASAPNSDIHTSDDSATQSPVEKNTVAAARSELRRWYQLRHLKVGAGVTVKNDLASGINLYWGCSGRMGNGLSFSGHVDVLRRACCAVSSTLGPLELSSRLRVNLITYHRTALDIGVCWRPFESLPHTKVRASSSGRGQCIGVQMEDATHEVFTSWIRRHAESRRKRVATHESEGQESQKMLHASNKQIAPSSSHKNDPAADGGGGWISFGWASAAWHAVRGYGTPHDGGGHDAHTHQKTNNLTNNTTDSKRWWQPTVSPTLISAGQRAGTAVASTWRAVATLDWLEAALDEVRLDVSVGVTHDNAKRWRSFVVVSAR